MKAINFYKPGLCTLLFSIFFFLPAKGQVTTLKIELHNNQLWINAGLKGTTTDSLKFLFDSGAATSVLDSAVAAKIFPDGAFKEAKAMGASGNSAARRLENESVYLNGLELDNINFLITDLSRFASRFGRKADGIIGYDLLKKYVTRIDIDHKTLSIYRDIKDINAEKGKPIAFDFGSELKYFPKLMGSFTTQAGQSYSGYFIFDSGAGLTALLNTPFVNENQLLSQSGKVSHLKAEGLTNTSDNYVARITSFSFNGETFKDLPISMSQTTAGVNSMKGYAGLIGNKLLFRYNLIFDYKHKTIYFQPNSYYSSKFEFPLCGFMLKLRDGNIYIDYIMPDSPEEGQGLEAGDQLITVNGKTGLTIEEIRELLKHEGKITLNVKQKSGNKEFVIDLYPRI